MLLKTGLTAAVICFIPALAVAGPEAFEKGPVFEAFGEHAAITGAQEIAENTIFNIAFDIKDAGDGEAPSRRINSAARFINMHAAAGIDPDNINLAMVIHGKAVMDVTGAARYGGDNPSADLIAALQNAGVSFYVCGQSAAYYDVSTDDLLPGVIMSLSAMTAHAKLQQSGYTLNPF